MAQTTCNNPAGYRFTWPGNDESFICEDHVDKLRGVADAMSLPLQIIELDDDDGETCRQKVSG